MKRTEYTIRPEHIDQLRQLLNQPATDPTPPAASDGNSDYMFRWVVAKGADPMHSTIQLCTWTLYRPDTETWEEGPDDERYVLRSRIAGEVYSPGSRLVAMLTGYSDEASPRAVYMPSSGSGEMLTTLLGKAKRNGCWLYKHKGAVPKKDYCDYGDSDLVGDCGAYVTVTHIQDADSPTVPQIDQVCIVGATGGTFTLAWGGGGTSGNISFDGSNLSSMVSGMEGGITVTSAGGGCFNLSYNDNEGHGQPTADCTNLLPKPKNPAVEVEGSQLARTVPDNLMPCRVLLQIRYQAAMKTPIEEEIEGDPELTTHETWHFWLEDVCGGNFKLKIDSHAWTTCLDSQAVTGSSIASALNAVSGSPTVTVTGSGTAAAPWVVTVTGDDNPHTLEIDTTSCSPPLWDCTNYMFQWDDTSDSGSGGCPGGMTGDVPFVSTVACDPDLGLAVSYKQLKVQGGCVVGVEDFTPE